MLYVGNHLSSSKGFEAMGKQALKLNATTFAFFTRNPRGGSVKELNLLDIEKFLHLSKEHGFGPLVAHAPYTLNPCSGKEEVRAFAKQAFLEDLKRLDYLPGNYYNFHPGSHVGQGVEVGISYILEMLNTCMYEDMKTTVLLETMAGKGSEIGSTFEELKSIIDGCNYSHHLGVCLDTCHVWDAGYDIVTDLDGVLQEFDKIIGLKYLKALHLNDSMNPLGARKDRHARLGEGYIGLETFYKVISHKSLKGKSFVLETPNDDEGWACEIALLQNAYKN